MSTTKKASKKVYNTYNIKRNELELLVTIAILLMIRDKDKIGIQPVLQFLGVNPYWRRRELAGFYQLERLGMTAKHRARRGENFSITQLGRQTLDFYDYCIEDEASQRAVNIN